MSSTFLNPRNSSNLRKESNFFCCSYAIKTRKNLLSNNSLKGLRQQKNCISRYPERIILSLAILLQPEIKFRNLPAQFTSIDADCVKIEWLVSGCRDDGPSCDIGSSLQTCLGSRLSSDEPPSQNSLSLSCFKNQKTS